MSAHLPECPGYGTEDADLPWHVDCICPALRACTVRVLGEAREAVAATEITELAPRQTKADCLAAIDRLAQEAP